MGHRMRVANQKISLQNIHNEMREEAENGKSDKAIIIIDFKMKFEACYFREKR